MYFICIPGDNTQNDPQQRSESKASSRLESDFYLILMVIFSKTLRWPKGLW